MKAALTSELRKWTSTRLWWVLLLVMAAYMAFLAVVMAFSVTIEPGDAGAGATILHGTDAALTVYTLGNALGYVFPLLAGAIAMTSEFRYQTITPALLADPRRSVFLGAKLLSATVIGLAFGLVGTLSSVAAGAPILSWRGDGAYLGSSDVLVPVALSVVALAIWAFVGVGVGTLITNQVAAIVVVLAFTQFVEPIVRLGLSAVDALEGVAKFLPGAASEALVGASTYASLGMSDLLGRVPGALVFLAYGLVLALIGRFTTLRRDIT
ncbi:ABC transporter permease [Mumia zhuanghuii]|uniref:ABC transporter permease n=2 Tax=Mumia TaxID=1546255 RepID=A0ABW1QIC6_9ACTN|nr:MULTISPECIES: ABC transporter permease [Mumia]KAA1425389.1 ABC transporter permease [Mumia zhuanghuii]